MGTQGEGEGEGEERGERQMKRRRGQKRAGVGLAAGPRNRRKKEGSCIRRLEERARSYDFTMGALS